MKRKALTMNKTKRLLFMAMVAAACAMPCIVLADGAARDESSTWTPGAPNPDCPHVVAAQEEGKWT